MTTNRAFIPVCPAASVSLVNACLENIELGPGNLGIAIAPAIPAPTHLSAPTAYAAHWSNMPPQVISTIEGMVAGVIPTSFVDEFDRNRTAVWGTGGKPTAVEAIAAMATVTAKKVTYDPANPDFTYDSTAELNAMLAAMGLALIPPPPEA